MIADYVKGHHALESLPEGIKQGILMHRAIDHYTDTHPLVIEAVKRMSTIFGRYASVALDILFDYFLCKNWYIVHSPSFNLEDFKQFVYQVLTDYEAYYQPPYLNYIREMVKNDWLTSYSTREGIEYVFFRTNARISQKGIFDNAFERIAPDVNYLNEVFLTFYPALQLHVKQSNFLINT